MITIIVVTKDETDRTQQVKFTFDDKQVAKLFMDAVEMAINVIVAFEESTEFKP